MPDLVSMDFAVMEQSLAHLGADAKDINEFAGIPRGVVNAHFLALYGTTRSVGDLQMQFIYEDTAQPLKESMWEEQGFVAHVSKVLGGSTVPTEITPCKTPVIPQVVEEAPLSAAEIRAELARERREATKARQLDRNTKRKHKRSQSY